MGVPRLDLALGTQAGSDFELKRDREWTPLTSNRLAASPPSPPSPCPANRKSDCPAPWHWTGVGYGGERTQQEVSIDFPPVPWVGRLRRNDSIS